MDSGRDRFHSYEVVILNDSTNVYRDHGMTLAKVIAMEQEIYSQRFEGWKSDGVDLAEFVRCEPDRVVWSDDRVVCVLRPGFGSLDVLPSGVVEASVRPARRTPEDRNPDDESNLVELPRDICDQAIARWVQADREQAEAYRLAGDHPEYEAWTDHTTAAEMAARGLLIKAILAYDPDYSGVRRLNAEHRRWKPRALRSQGKLYITAPNPDRDEGLDGIPENIDGPGLMQLFVVEESRIIDVERGGYLEPVEVQAATVIGATAEARTEASR